MKKYYLILAILFFTAMPSSHGYYDSSIVSLGNHYQKILKRYTRQKAKYSINEMEALFKWYATYESPEFQKAFLEYYNHYYPSGSPELAEKSALQNTNSTGQAEFFVAVYAKATQLKKMDGVKNLWNLSLVADGRTYQPSELVEIPLSPFYQRFFPYISKWYRCYRVTFPYQIQENDFDFTLQLASAAGVSRMHFKN